MAVRRVDCASMRALRRGKRAFASSSVKTCGAGMGFGIMSPEARLVNVSAPEPQPGRTETKMRVKK